MRSDNNKSLTSNWLLFLFFGSLLFGVLYATYLHGFLNYSTNDDFNKASNTVFITPKLAIIPERTPASIANGEKNYNNVCVSCHGAYDKYKAGLLGPDLSDKKWLHASNEKALGLLIINGITAEKSITGQVMPAKGGGNLNDPNVWEIIYYLSSKNKSIQKDVKATGK